VKKCYQVIVVDVESVKFSAQADGRRKVFEKVLADDQLLQVLQLSDAQRKILDLRKIIIC
jgi:hypothetical protein